MSETTAEKDANAGVWVAYYLDRSSFVVFSAEIDALRYAVGGHRGMEVSFAPFGSDLTEIPR